MTAVIISLFTLGAVDALDPYDLTTTLLLLQLVRKDWHVLLKIWIAYITYWVTAIGIYYGVTAYLLAYWDKIIGTFPEEIRIMQIAIGFLALAAAIVLTFRLFRNWSAGGEDISKIIYIKSVHPVFIAAFAIFSVWSSIPAFWPLYAFITVLVNVKISTLAVVLFLGLFTLFCYLPQLFVYSLYKRLEAERFSRIMGRMKRILCRTMLIVIPVFLLFISIWGFSEAIQHLRT